MPSKTNDSGKKQESRTKSTKPAKHAAHSRTNSKVSQPPAESKPAKRSKQPSNSLSLPERKKPSLASLPIIIEVVAPALKSMIKQDKIRQKKAAKLVGGLRKKHMMAGGTEEIEMQDLNFRSVIDIDAYEARSRYMIWAKVTLGDDDKGVTSHWLMFDTCHALTWVSKAAYVDARTPQERQALTPSQGERDQVNFGYLSEPNLTLTGEVYSDTLEIGTESEGVTIEGQKFAVVEEAPATHLPGFLSCGPRRLCKGTVVGHPNRVYNTFLDNLVSQGIIRSKIFGLALRPHDENDTALVSIRGKIDFGGTKAEQPLVRIPSTLISPSKSFHGVDLKLTLDPETPGGAGAAATLLSGSSSSGGYCPGLIDSGTQLIYLERTCLRAYMALVGAQYDDEVRGWWMHRDMKHKLRNLNFNFNNGVFVFPPSAQVIPPEMNQEFDPDFKTDRIYFVLREFDQAIAGRMFILGLAWIQRYYVGYDLCDPAQAYALIGYSRYTMLKWRGMNA